MKDVSPTATTPTATSYQKNLSPPKRYSSLNFQGKQQSLQPDDRAGKYSVSPRRSFSSNAYAEYEPEDDYFGGGSNRGDGDVQMTFESSWDDPPRKTARSPSPPIQMTFDSHYDDYDSYGSGKGGNGGYGAIKQGSSSARATSLALSFEPPSPRRSFDVSAGKSGHDNGTLRPELTSSNTMPAKVGAGGNNSNTTMPKRNPWDDDEDEFAPKEMTMSFE